MPEEKKGLFRRLRDGLNKTRQQLTERISEIIAYHRNMDDEFFEEMEEVLIASDLGVETSLELVAKVRERVDREKIGDPNAVYQLMRDAMREMIDGSGELEFTNGCVVLMVGVNGVGKTTTCGKIAYQLKQAGRTVILGAADTFRAAATEQLQEWGRRANAPVIHHQEGADPAAVVFDAMSAQRARNVDVLLCDTAGRLHNKKNLMAELEKIHRVVERESPDAQKEILLVVDATTGQNAVEQARVFAQACKITGIVLTKLDGSAKGGVVIAIARELGVPVRFVGVGESAEDLQPFDPDAFVESIL